jgi:hypothetical protein
MNNVDLPRAFDFPEKYYGQEELLKQVLEELVTKIVKDESIFFEIVHERNSDSNYIKRSTAGWIQLYMRSDHFCDSLSSLTPVVQLIYEEGNKIFHERNKNT